MFGRGVFKYIPCESLYDDNIKTVTEDGKRIEYFYDEWNQLIRENNGILDKTVVYAYDAGGNLTSKTEYPYTEGEPGEPAKAYDYLYEDANWKDKLTSFDGKAITYDEIGNPLTYNGWTYSWDAGRQLASMAKEGTDLSFKYNDSGVPRGFPP